MLRIFSILACTTVLYTSCSLKGSTGNGQVEATEDISTTTPDFIADSAYQYIADQVSFGPRVPNTKAHLECSEYIASKLESFGAKVTIQEAEVSAFDGTRLKIRNIIGEFQPEKSSRVMLFAHWDTRPFADHDPDPTKRDIPIEGANDGASGVGVLLEIARHLAAYPTNPGIDIILFDAEDYGQPDHRSLPYQPDSWCLGSQYWGKNPHKKNYYARFGVLLDMVGAKNALFYREQYSEQTALRWVDRIWNIARDLGYGGTFVFGKGGMITDDHVYVNRLRGFPCVDIIQYDPTSRTGFGAYWHTHDDTMDNIDRNTLKAVGQTVMELIYREK